ncbi:MAG TPA: efflux RND transporter periplasmic adaptor subunit, partial [Gemmatimonadaceae bacterium]|nr:efflux RND transporter periplasmic adaptor subunit [Gemmatimonadaceae bacterium]
VEATGTIEAQQSIDLRPEGEGRLVQIYVREGSIVGRGTPLFKIDDASLKAQVARAEAERDLARQALTRTRQLLEQNATSASELERAEATARSTQATLDLLQLSLERTTVRAPFGGVVGRRLVSLGDYVTPQRPLISLQTYDPQRAVFQIPERFADRVANGQRVEFSVASLPGKTFSGVVDFVDPVVQLPGRTVLVKARVPNPSRALQAGMFIEVSLATATRENAVVIPEDAVLTSLNQRIVWVVSPQNKVERREVTIGVRRSGFVEITQGVTAGEKVVVGGAERLQPGAPVTPMERGAKTG